MESVKPYKCTATTRLFDQFNVILHLAGYKNFWVQQVNFPKTFINIFEYMDIVIQVLCIAFSVMEFGALFTQHKLTPKQEVDRNVINIYSPIIHMYSIKFYLNRKEIRQLFYFIAVLLKEDYNDPDVEKSMVTKLKAYLFAYAWSSFIGLTSYGVTAIVTTISEDVSFVTVITIWPDVQDRSKPAEIARIIIYLFWWIQFYRISVAYFLSLSMLIGICHQYMNLGRYFYSLQIIFDDRGINQKEKEKKYIDAFIFGIKLHTSTIWCTTQCQSICREIYASQVLLLTGVLINFLPGMFNCREDIQAACVRFPSFLFILLIMGFLMWPAGDITVEAAKIPEAMYGSGWENCYGQSAVRARKLVVIAMTQAQQPVVLTAFSVVKLSYETYVAVLKSAYSVFSVFY